MTVGLHIRGTSVTGRIVFIFLYGTKQTQMTLVLAKLLMLHKDNASILQRNEFENTIQILNYIFIFTVNMMKCW